jgi:hypothetical protein
MESSPPASSDDGSAPDTSFSIQTLNDNPLICEVLGLFYFGARESPFAASPVPWPIQTRPDTLSHHINHQSGKVKHF